MCELFVQSRHIARLNSMRTLRYEFADHLTVLSLGSILFSDSSNNPEFVGGQSGSIYWPPPCRGRDPESQFWLPDYMEPQTELLKICWYQTNGSITRSYPKRS